MSEEMSRARKEINKSLEFCNLCTRLMGISFIDKPPSTVVDKLKSYFWKYFSATFLYLLVFGETFYVLKQHLMGTASVAQFVLRFHIVGYGIVSKY